MAKILVDVCHPAHAHFFRVPICLWTERGHDVAVTSRNKDVAIEILDALGIAHHSLGNAAQGPLGLVFELVQRNLLLTRHIRRAKARPSRSEEHTSELQSLMRISYAVFCLKKKKNKKTNT